ncbi:hemerythrin domain-containing protein [Branchiibius cervicis]|uniref:Hemerythrin domain-containing protein n=1 Tax=Branchiibius cervicis TaxID=908252 RepID=A0ABW2AXW3_9MICO
MISIHRVFRRELGLLPASIRQVAAGDRRRVKILADHLGLVAGGLHTHHTHEDEMMWPLLQQRVPAELEPLVDLMEEQHERVADLGERVQQHLAAWTASAAGSDGARLADALDDLVAALCETPGRRGIALAADHGPPHPAAGVGRLRARWRVQYAQESADGLPGHDALRG